MIILMEGKIPNDVMLIGKCDTCGCEVSAVHSEVIKKWVDIDHAHTGVTINLVRCPTKKCKDIIMVGEE